MEVGPELELQKGKKVGSTKGMQKQGQGKLG